MWTIYIDTHFTELVIALFKDGQIVAERKIESNKHTENAISLLNEILKDNCISIDKLNEIIVINGPGSFTGVRIGIVIAKIIAYTKNITLRSISYLEAMALNYDKKIVLGIKDRNGAFIGEFDEYHNLINDYYYLSKEELEIREEIVYDVKIDLEKVYKFVQTKDVINPHMLKALYVKKIEVEKC